MLTMLTLRMWRVCEAYVKDVRCMWAVCEGREGCYLYASIFERYHQELELSKASQFKMYTMF